MTSNVRMRILVADDEPGIRESLKEIFHEDGYDVVTAENERSAIEALEKSDSSYGVDLAIIDIKLGNDDGIQVLRRCRSQFPSLPVIMITGFGSVALAKEAFKLGVHDFLEKPLRLVQVRTCVRNALESIRLKRELSARHDGIWSRPVYASEKMKDLLAQASKVASVKEPVVISGPSGSGKELLARHLHNESPRSAGPFIATNAASMPVSLAEDELFGHERGAFTGAEKKREGCIEQADKGTLFLDEIADMDPLVQAKLLRVLESGTFQRLGGSAPVHVDVRIVCATHKDMEELVRAGKFRHDLWYRISAFVLQVPGLDKRKNDIPLLADHFLFGMAQQLGIEKKFTPAALDMLSDMHFPGNVRELKHLVARCAVYSEGHSIDVNDILSQYGQKQTMQVQGTPASDTAVSGDLISGDFKEARVRFEKEFLRNALAKNEGNISATARAIGMAQSNLSRKLKELGL